MISSLIKVACEEEQTEIMRQLTRDSIFTIPSSVSKSCASLIRLLLHPNPLARLSVHDALMHEWTQSNVKRKGGKKRSCSLSLVSFLISSFQEVRPPSPSHSTHLGSSNSSYQENDLPLSHDRCVIGVSVLNAERLMPLTLPNNDVSQLVHIAPIPRRLSINASIPSSVPVGAVRSRSSSAVEATMSQSSPATSNTPSTQTVKTEKNGIARFCL